MSPGLPAGAFCVLQHAALARHLTNGGLISTRPLEWDTRRPMSEPLSAIKRAEERESTHGGDER